MVVDPRLIGLGGMPHGLGGEKGGDGVSEEERGIEYSRNIIGCGIGLLSGFLIAYKRVITIKGKDSIHILHNLFWFQLGGSLFASLVNIWFGRNNVFRMEDWPRVLVIALLGGTAHGTIVHVMRLEPNALIGLVICNLAIVWCFMLDTWYFGNPFSVWSGVGAVIITICSALISL